MNFRNVINEDNGGGKTKIKSLHIAIVCCNCIAGEGIKSLIEKEPYVSSVTDCSEAEEVIRTGPDLLILDLNSMSRLFIDNVSGNGIKILILGSASLPSVEEKILRGLIARGLIGIIPPESDSRLLKRAIKAVASGELWFERKQLSSIFSMMKDTQKEEMERLTQRETEIVNQICKGYRNKEIMTKLNISEQSVKSHLNRIYKKTGVCDRLQLALYALKRFDEFTPWS